MEQQSQSGDNNQVQTNNNPGANAVPSTSSRPNSTIGYAVIPYTKGLAESFKHTCGKQVWDTNILQRQHYNQTSPHETQRPGLVGNLVSSVIT